MQQHFPCHRCGTYNLIGSPTCSHCRQQLYYNCPHCRSWVDNRYSHCPQCHSPLSWPHNTVPQNAYGETWYRPQSNYVEDKKGNPLPAILVSLFIVGVVALIFINPGSSSATRSDTANAILTTKASASPSASQPQITLSSPAGPSSPSSSAPSTSQVTSGDSAAYLPAGVSLTTSSGEIVEIEITPVTGSTSSGSSTVKRSAYLQQLWPTWGHCTKGSCQAYTQQ